MTAASVCCYKLSSVIITHSIYTTAADCIHEHSHDGLVEPDVTCRNRWWHLVKLMRWYWCCLVIAILFLNNVVNYTCVIFYLLLIHQASIIPASPFAKIVIQQEKHIICMYNYIQQEQLFVVIVYNLDYLFIHPIILKLYIKLYYSHLVNIIVVIKHQSERSLLKHTFILFV